MTTSSYRAWGIALALVGVVAFSVRPILIKLAYAYVTDPVTLIALRMVFPHPDGIFGEANGAEPFLVPLAVPSIAGPSALATVMLMASRDPAHMTTWVIALSVGMALTTLVLLAAQRLQAVLGERAIQAFEKLMGLVLTALAVEMLLNGVRTFAARLPA